VITLRVTIVIRYERGVILSDKQHPLFVTAAGTAARVAVEASSNKYVVNFTSMFCKASDQRQVSHYIKPCICRIKECLQKGCTEPGNKIVVSSTTFR
jgi:hypothetical protein